MSGWEQYIYQLQNRYDSTTEQYTKTNVNAHAGIYGMDGTPWACSANFKLTAYDFDVTIEDGSTKKVPVNEFYCAQQAVKGNRRPCEAGVRMLGKKFMLLQHNPSVKSAYLAMEGGGGACICETKSAIVISVWDKA